MPPPVTLRVNLLKGSVHEIALQLFDEGIETVSVSKLPGCLIVKKGNPTETKAFHNGLFHVQDMASQLCAMVAASGKPKNVF